MHNLQAYRIYHKWACIFAIIQAVGLLDAGYLLGDSPVDRCVKSDKSLTNICEEVVVVVLRGFFMSHRQLRSYGDGTSDQSLIRKTGSQLDFIHPKSMI